MRTILILAAVIFLASPARGECLMSYCGDTAPSRSYVTDNHRRIVGDLYRPGRGRRVQIRDTSRRILGYIEMDGTITNLSRQEIGSVQRLIGD